MMVKTFWNGVACYNWEPDSKEEEIAANERSIAFYKRDFPNIDSRYKRKSDRDFWKRQYEYNIEFLENEIAYLKNQGEN